jgi:hypothetical protein
MAENVLISVIHSFAEPKLNQSSNQAILQIKPAYAISDSPDDPVHDISLGSIHLGRGNPLFLIASPCG